MNRIYQRCPQCQGKECNDCSCKFTGRKHTNAAPQGSEAVRPAINDSKSLSLIPAVAAPDIGYECAWPNA